MSLAEYPRSRPAPPSSLIVDAPAGWHWMAYEAQPDIAYAMLVALAEAEVTNTRGGPVVIPS